MQKCKVGKKVHSCYLLASTTFQHARDFSLEANSLTLPTAPCLASDNMANYSGQRNGACSGIPGNMAAIHSKETYREQVPFLSVTYLLSTFASGPAFHRRLFSKLAPYNALYRKGSKSNICIPTRFWCAVAEDVNGKFQVPQLLEEKLRMMYNLTNFHLQCWFLSPANCLQTHFRIQNSTDQYENQNLASRTKCYLIRIWNII